MGDGTIAGSNRNQRDSEQQAQPQVGDIVMVDSALPVPGMLGMLGVVESVVAKSSWPETWCRVLFPMSATHIFYSRSLLVVGHVE